MKLDPEIIIGFFAAIIIIYAQITYLYAIYKNKIRPSYLSWLGWAILTGVSFVSQVISEGWSLKLIGLLISTIGCFLIALCAKVVFKHYSMKREDLKFLYLGLICIVVYVISKNPWLATVSAIIADLILAIPTFKNAYINPMEEQSIAWPLSLLSWTLTMTLVFMNFSWIHFLWPLYLILFCGVMTYLTYLRPTSDLSKT